MQPRIVTAATCSLHFAGLARPVAPDIAKVERRPCPDQYIGQVCELERNRSITVRLPAENRLGTPGLLVVLESPHIAEFKTEPAPARGTTGLQIARYLREVVGSSIRDEHPITLLNAVRYQCSLGFSPGSFRDKVFTSVWLNGGREDFASRLQSLYHAGDIILCSCTKGGSNETSKQLRQLVYAAIIESLPLAQVERCTHPASWHSPRNRLHRWSAA